MYNLELIGRKNKIFHKDILDNFNLINERLLGTRIMVVGGAGSIGQAVTIELLKFKLKALHIVDISENNMVELVRKIRSTIGYFDTEFKTFAIDSGAIEFKALINSEKGYDYVFNLSALKHVRSEKDPFTLMRLITVNIFNTIDNIKLFRKKGLKKYFCVSTDKAANPANMMGGSKKIMELFLNRESQKTIISTARFANVAFSDGSLLHGFNQRLLNNHPISAPKDIKRYFILPEESGQLCLMSGVLGKNRNIFFPKLDKNINLVSFADIARSYLRLKGFEPYECETEEKARLMTRKLIKNKKWPCFFFDSDTTGEKAVEEFYTSSEKIDNSQYEDIGIILNKIDFNSQILDEFDTGISELKSKGNWNKSDITKLFHSILPNFMHIERDKFLDDRM